MFLLQNIGPTGISQPLVIFLGLSTIFKINSNLLKATAIKIIPIHEFNHTCINKQIITKITAMLHLIQNSYLLTNYRIELLKCFKQVHLLM
jgi:hypothetical protein